MRFYFSVVALIAFGASVAVANPFPQPGELSPVFQEQVI